MKLTQCQKILDYMQKFGSITPMDALQEFGCMILAARIADLKEQGYPIESKTRTGRNRMGESVNFAEYFLQEVSK